LLIPKSKLSHFSNKQTFRSFIKTFPSLTQQQLVWITSRLQPQRYLAGSVIVQKGEPADKFYIVTKGQVEIVLQYWLFALCLGANMPLHCLFLAVPLVSLAAMLPLSLNGIGIREWVMVWISQPLGTSEADAVMMPFLYLCANLFYAVLGAMLFFRTRGRPPRQ